MEVIAIVALICGFFWVWGLQDRVNQLEKKLFGESQPEIPMIAADVEEYEDVEPVSTKGVNFAVSPSVKHAPQIAQKAKDPVDWEAWITKRFFPILGSVSLLIGIAYFVVMAVANQWVGPSGQVALGALGSVLLLGLGEFAQKKYPQFAPYITATGIAGLILITFVARSVYGMISAPESLLLYSLEVAAGVALSLRYDSRILANLAMLGGLFAPLLTKAEEPNALGLMAFLIILTIGSFIISTHKKWTELLVMMLVGVSFFEFFLARTDGFESDPILFLVLIYGVHLLLGSGGFVRNLINPAKQETLDDLEAEDQMDVIVLIGSVIVANILGYFIFDSQGWDHFGFLVLLQGFLFYGLSMWSQARGLMIYNRLCLVGALVSVLFATIWELNGADEIVLSLALAVEATLFAWCGRQLGDHVFRAFGAAAVVLAFLIGLSVTGLMWSGFISLIVILALVSVALSYEDTEAENVIAAFAIFFATAMMVHWNVEILSVYLKNNDIEVPQAALFVLPVLWTYGMSWIARVKQQEMFLWGALIIFALTNLVGLTMYGNDLGESLMLFALMIGGAIMIGQNYIALDIPEKSHNVLGWALMVPALLHVFAFGIEALDEPITTLFWLGAGIGSLLFGSIKSWALFRYAGLGVILLVIAKLYIIDIWEWETWMRFVAFFALGIALLLIAFYAQKFTQKK